MFSRESLFCAAFPASAGLLIADGMRARKTYRSKKAVAQGKYPSLEKQREKCSLTTAMTFGDGWPMNSAWAIYRLISRIGVLFVSQQQKLRLNDE